MHSKHKLVVAALALATVVACAAPAGTSSGPANGSAAAPRPTATSRSAAVVRGPTFREVLAASKLSEYKVAYKTTERYGLDTSSGEQTWFVKPPNARFDFSSAVGVQRTAVSLYALAEGVFMCYRDVARVICLRMSGLSPALQQNPAASIHQLFVQHPEGFDGALVERPRIAAQDALCYDVRALTVQVSGLTDGRFCYGLQGAPLLLQFKTQGAEVSMEATRFSAVVPDSDFTLPAEATTLGRP